MQNNKKKFEKIASGKSFEEILEKMGQGRLFEIDTLNKSNKIYPGKARIAQKNY